DSLGRVLVLEPKCPFERGERELVDAQRAVQRMTAEPLDQFAATHDDAGLRAAEQLVAGEADDVCACSERVTSGLLAGDVIKDAGAEIVYKRHAVALRDGGELRNARELREADHAEIRLVHA